MPEQRRRDRAVGDQVALSALRDKARATGRARISAAPSSTKGLDPERLIRDSQERRKQRAATASNEGEGPISFAPIPQPEMEWRDEPKPVSVRNVDWVEQADRALSVNALREAIHLSEKALTAAELPSDVQARMWLVQTIARYWLGDFAGSHDAAEKAKRRLVRGSTGWHAAFGHLVMSAGHLGRKPTLFSAVKELEGLTKIPGGIANQGFLVSCCRLAVFAMRTGLVEIAHDLVRDVTNYAANPNDAAPFVRAWIDVASAEMAVHSGDLTAYVQHIHSAVELFTTANDLRNACLQRTNLGNGFLHLGAHEHAAKALEIAITLAEPMQLAIISGVARANLGIALANSGRLDEGIRWLTLALEYSRIQGNVRAEAYAMTYLARILAPLGEIDVAFNSVRQAAMLAENIPGLKAFALAVQADILLTQGQPAAALDLATMAMSILQALEGVEEGESLIRVVHVLALRGVGQTQDATHWIKLARRGLRVKAARIGDERWRRCFVENDPDNARLLKIASQWAQLQ